MKKRAGSLYLLKFRQNMKISNRFFKPNPDWKGFNMIYHSTLSDAYLWLLTLHGKLKKKKKRKHTQIQSSSQISNGLNDKDRQFMSK